MEIRGGEVISVTHMLFVNQIALYALGYLLGFSLLSFNIF